MSTRVNGIQAFDHEGKFLTDMLVTNKVYVNVKDICPMEDIIIWRLWHSIKHMDRTPQAVLKITRCGSMAEQTRVWDYEEHQIDNVIRNVLVIEFDFLAVQKTPVSISRYIQDTLIGVLDKDCKDHTTVMCSNVSQYYDLPYINNNEGNDLRVSPRALRQWFRSEVLKNIHRGEGEDRLTFTPSILKEEDRTDDSIRYAFTWKQPLTQRPRPTLCPEIDSIRYDCCVIKVDFMPAFQCMPTDDFDYLVPKYLSDTATCFLNSYCIQERQMFEKTSPVHREANMLLKLLYSHAHSQIPTYILKTAVLHHAETCTEPNLVACLRQMLQLLSSSFSIGELLSFKGHINLLSHWRPHVLERMKCVPDTLLRFLDDLKQESQGYSFCRNACKLNAHCSKVTQWKSNRRVPS